MKLEHTPGEWIDGPMSGEYRHRVFANNGKSLIAETLSRDHDEDHANGRLIAAAPMNLIRDIEINKMARGARTIGTIIAMEAALTEIVSMADENINSATGKTWEELNG